MKAVRTGPTWMTILTILTATERIVTIEGQLVCYYCGGDAPLECPPDDRWRGTENTTLTARNKYDLSTECKVGAKFCVKKFEAPFGVRRYCSNSDEGNYCGLKGWIHTCTNTCAHDTCNGGSIGRRDGGLTQIMISGLLAFFNRK